MTLWIFISVLTVISSECSSSYPTYLIDYIAARTGRLRYCVTIEAIYPVADLTVKEASYMEATMSDYTL